MQEGVLPFCPGSSREQFSSSSVGGGGGNGGQEVVAVTRQVAVGVRLRRGISDAQCREVDDLVGLGCCIRLLIAEQTALIACPQQRHARLELAGVVF